MRFSLQKESSYPQHGQTLTYKNLADYICGDELQAQTARSGLATTSFHLYCTLYKKIFQDNFCQMVITTYTTPEAINGPTGTPRKKNTPIIVPIIKAVATSGEPFI